jgi:hypothetical protein
VNDRASAPHGGCLCSMFSPSTPERFGSAVCDERPFGRRRRCRWNCLCTNRSNYAQDPGGTGADVSRGLPIDGGAYTPPNKAFMPPERTTSTASTSSMLSAPAHIPAISVTSFSAGLAPPT